MLSDDVEVRDWQVGQLVNVRFTDRKFYGAFISKINNDGTYNAYFYESSESLYNVKPKNIKSPLVVNSERRLKSWSKYTGKVFFDTGTEGGNDEEYFEPGEFVVKSVTSDNNFLCHRLGEKNGDSEVFDIGYVIKRIRVYEEE